MEYNLPELTSLIPIVALVLCLVEVSRWRCRGVRPIVVTSVVLMTAMLTLAIESDAQVYNAAADFAGSTNPNGAWSYGSSASFGSFMPFMEYTTFNAGGTVDYLHGTGDFYPAVFHNASAAVYDSSDPGPGIFPGRLAIHAGSSTLGVVRWTAPANGSYSIVGFFYGVTTDTTNVYVGQDSNVLFSAGHAGLSDVDSFTLRLKATESESIWFGVERTGALDFDYVGLDAVITAVPEPTLTAKIIGVTLLFLATPGTARRSRRRMSPSRNAFFLEMINLRRASEG